MGSKPKKPEPVAAQTKLIDLGDDDETGASSIEKDIKRLRKKNQTVFAGETGGASGYGGNTKMS